MLLHQKRGTVSLRVIEDADLAFLKRVYDSTREWEFESAFWEAAAKAEFLNSQFKAQDLSYKTSFPGALHRIIQLDGTDIGRLIVERQNDLLLIIDLSILTAFRGRGIGTDILRSLLNEAYGGKVPVRLHVQQSSPALSLYLRHGFRATATQGPYVAMEWTPQTCPRET